MTTTEKIQKILENAGSCRHRIENVIAVVSDPDAPLPGGVADWLRKIGVEDQRIESSLDDSLSHEARTAMFCSLMNKYRLNNQATAALLGCSTALISSYRCGRREIPIRRLLDFQRIIDSIDNARLK